MKRANHIILTTLLTLVMAAPAAFAGLASVGPLNPATGFPQYYVDGNGVALELPAPPFGTPAGKGVAVNPPTMVFDAPDPLNAFSQTIGFGTEAFYFACTSTINTAFGKATFLVGLEASFANAPPKAVNGVQTVFSRLRLTFAKAPVAGTYTLDHPYGTETIVVTPADITAKKGIKFTRDIPLGIPLNFTGALTGDVGPFLSQASPPPVITPGTPPPFDTGWIGDGVTSATISGSPIGRNFIRLTAPAGVNLDGRGQNAVQTNLFVVSGHRAPVAPPTPLTVNAITYTTDLLNNIYFDVFATSALGATVNTTIGGTVYPLTAGFGDEAGLYFARVPFITPLLFPFPGNIPVTAKVGTNLGTTIREPVTDVVNVTLAEWHSSNKIMTIQASSSDQVGNPLLTVTNPPIGNLVGGLLSYLCNVPPATVTVTSAQRGSTTVPVIVITP
jgi:hypothetical protein